MMAQSPFQLSQYFTHTRFRERIEEKNHKRIVGKGEFGRVGADRLERETFLRVASVLAQVLLRDLVQTGEKFHAYDAAERIVRRHQQGASLAGSEIDESEVAEVKNGLVGSRRFLQRVEHLVKRRRFGWLICGMEHAQQSIAPSHGSAGGVDPVLPVVVGISVALPQTLRSGVAHELPKHPQKAASREPVALIGGAVLPPARPSPQHADFSR